MENKETDRPVGLRDVRSIDRKAETHTSFPRTSCGGLHMNERRHAQPWKTLWLSGLSGAWRKRRTHYYSRRVRINSDFLLFISLHYVSGWGGHAFSHMVVTNLTNLCLFTSQSRLTRTHSNATYTASRNRQSLSPPPKYSYGPCLSDKDSAAAAAISALCA